MWIWFVVVLGSIPCLILLIINLAEGFGFFVWPILFAEFLLLAAVFVLRQALGSGSREPEAPSAWYARWRNASEPQVPAYRQPAGPRPSELPQRAAYRSSAAARRTGAGDPAAVSSSPPTSDGADRGPDQSSRAAPPPPWPVRSGDGHEEPSRARVPRPPRPAAPLFRGAQRFRPTGSESAEEPASQPPVEPAYSAPAADGGQSQVAEERPSPLAGQLFRGTERFREPESPPKRKRPSPQASSPWGSAGQVFRGAQRFREARPPAEREPRD